MTFLDLVLFAQNPRFPGGPGFPGGRNPQADMTGVLIGFACCVGFSLLVGVFVGICQWKIFAKAGEPGWAALIPIYNMMVMARIAGRSEMDGLLTLIPCVGIYFAIVILI